MFILAYLLNVEYTFYRNMSGKGVEPEHNQQFLGALGL